METAEFQQLLDKTSSLGNAWKNARSCQRRSEALCVNSNDECFWFYAEQHFAMIAHFITTGKLLLNGKLLFSHHIEEYSDAICKYRSGSYDSGAYECLDPLSVICVPLTTISVDYFAVWWQRSNQMKVCCRAQTYSSL